MNYNTLIASVKNYLENTSTSLANEIPNFINFAERKIARELKSIIGIKTLTSQLVIGEPYYQKPSRWFETVSFSYEKDNAKVFLESRTREYIEQVFPNTSVLSQPKYYADFDMYRFFIGPCPDAAYNFEISYYERPEELSSTNQVNFLTEFVPELLLYATLLESAPFLKNDPRVATWQSLYDRALSSLISENNKRLADRSATAIEA